MEETSLVPDNVLKEQSRWRIPPDRVHENITLKELVRGKVCQELDSTKIKVGLSYKNQYILTCPTNINKTGRHKMHGVDTRKCKFILSFSVMKEDNSMLLKS